MPAARNGRACIVSNQPPERETGPAQVRLSLEVREESRERGTYLRDIQRVGRPPCPPCGRVIFRPRNPFVVRRDGDVNRPVRLLKILPNELRRERNRNSGVIEPAHVLHVVAERPRVPERPRGRVEYLHNAPRRDRKSTRLNSSHVEISYAVFRLKKKKT